MLTTRRLVVYLLLLFVASFLLSTVILLLIYKPWAKKEKIEGAMWIPKDEHPQYIRVVTRHGTETKVNDATQYEVNKYHTPDQSLSFEYEFKANAECVQVTFEGKDVWNYETTGPDVGYPKTIFFNINEKTSLFEFPEYFYYYKLHDDKWKLDFHMRRLAFVELDTAFQQNTQEVDFKKDGTDGIFTPKLGYLIISVKHANSKVWSTNKPSQAAKKVILKTVNNLTKIVAVHSVNGEIKLFSTSKKINKEGNN